MIDDFPQAPLIVPNFSFKGAYAMDLKFLISMRIINAQIR